MGTTPKQEALMATQDIDKSIMRRKPIDDIEEENKHSGLIRAWGSGS